MTEHIGLLWYMIEHIGFALQGVLGIKVKIMLDWDPKGKLGPTTPLPDLVTIHPPKEEDELRPPSMVEV